jgi:succinate-semialdehyde dehydrogenase/glutarate-semialdehyde dehydrogenase
MNESESELPGDESRAAEAKLRVLPDPARRGLFIAGQWCEASDGGTFGVVDPATGDELCQIADGTGADGLRALSAAADAQTAWAAESPRRRSDLLRAAFDLVTARSEELALLITLEMGKPLAESRGEVAYAAEFLRWFSEEAVRIGGRYGISPEGTGQMVVSKHPVGPCYLITPWNFPLAMATRKVAPALAAGCTVVLKPAALTPLTTLVFAQLMQEAGTPPGVINVVTTTSAKDVSGPILADPRLRKLSFTGSTPVGGDLLALAAKRVLRTSMELGGNAPFLVFADADLEAAVEGALIAKFRNVGQACTAANRFLVHAEVASTFASMVTDRVREMHVGPGTRSGVQIGPLIDEPAVRKNAALVADAVARGATLLTGGREIAGRGTFFEPTVLLGVPAASQILQEEIFGPVLAIATFTDDDEAIARANGTDSGLVAYAYTRDLARSQRLIDELETGMLGINTGLVSDAAAPFGGVKQSGLGREGGAEGIEEYLTTKYTRISR